MFQAYMRWTKDIPIIIDAGQNDEPMIENSIIEWAYNLLEEKHLTRNTIWSYVRGLCMFYNFVKFYDHFETTKNGLSKFMNQFQKALQEGFPELGWEKRSASDVLVKMSGIFSYFDFIDLDDVSLKNERLSNFVEIYKKKGLLGHIRPGRLAKRTKEASGDNRKRNIRKMKPDVEEIRYFPPSHFFALVDAMPSHRDKALSLLMAGTSARISQALNIWLPDIDFKNQIVKFVNPETPTRIRELNSKYGLIPDNKIRNKGELPGIWLTPLIKEMFFVEAILYYQDEYPNNIPYKPHPYFFCTRTGKRLSPRQFQRLFSKILIQIGVSGMTPHSLRHLYGFYSRFVLEIPEEVLQVNMGHHSIESTHKYGRISGIEAGEMMSEANKSRKKDKKLGINFDLNRIK
jgi:integrase